MLLTTERELRHGVRVSRSVRASLHILLAKLMIPQARVLVVYIISVVIVNVNGLRGHSSSVAEERREGPRQAAGEGWG